MGCLPSRLVHAPQRDAASDDENDGSDTRLLSDDDRCTADGVRVEWTSLGRVHILASSESAIPPQLQTCAWRWVREVAPKTAARPSWPTCEEICPQAAVEMESARLLQTNRPTTLRARRSCQIPPV